MQLRVDKMACCQNSLSAIVAIWQNDKLSKCQVDIIASCKNCMSTTVAIWQKGRLTKCHVGKVSCWLNDLAPRLLVRKRVFSSTFLCFLFFELVSSPLCNKPPSLSSSKCRPSQPGAVNFVRMSEKEITSWWKWIRSKLI